MQNQVFQVLAEAVKVDSLPGSKGPSLASTDELKIVLGVVFGIVGALSLLVITISGFRYIISAGDPKRTAQAKEGIIYALIGLGVALTAESIVTFVIGRVG